MWIFGLAYLCNALATTLILFFRQFVSFVWLSTNLAFLRSMEGGHFYYSPWRNYIVTGSAFIPISQRYHRQPNCRPTYPDIRKWEIIFISMMQVVLQHWSSFFGTRSGRSIGLTALLFALGFHKWNILLERKIQCFLPLSTLGIFRDASLRSREVDLIPLMEHEPSRPPRRGVYEIRNLFRSWSHQNPPSAETNIYKSMVFMSCFIDLPSCSFWTPFLVILISLNQVSVHSRTAAVKIHLKLHPPLLGRPNQLSMMILLPNAGHVLSPCMSPSRTHIVKTLNDDDAPFHLSPRIGLTTTTSQLLNSSMKRLRYV